MFSCDTCGNVMHADTANLSDQRLSDHLWTAHGVTQEARDWSDMFDC